MNKKTIFFGMFIFSVFVLFSWFVKNNVLDQLDFAFTVKLQEKIDTSKRLRLTEAMGNIMEGSSFFASPEFSVLFLIVLTGFVCVDIKNKKFRLYGLLIPLLFFIMTSVEVAGKTIIHHPSPPFFMIKNPSSVFPKYYVNDEFTFPSGHAARSAFLSLSLYSYLFFNLSLIKKSKIIHYGIALFIFIYISLVSISRIYLGHHWLSDVLGGLLLGTAASFFSYKAVKVSNH